MAPIGIYIHVPFCHQICNYCNFNRSLLDSALVPRYVSAVERHLGRLAARCSPGVPIEADTIYFGGGTPSVLAPADITRILGACRASFTVAPDAEITMEANPDSAVPEALHGYRAAGVNRLSIGVQSFRDDELQRLSRLHDAATARRAVRDARSAGFDNISIDLMMWLPGQTIDQWRESLDGLADVAPEHASMYMLELYPNAPLREEMARSHLSMTPDDDAAEMYELAMDAAAAIGMPQYEISNVAKPGRASRHNLKYWTDGEWLAVGPGGHSTFDGARWKSCAGIDEYVSGLEAGSDVERERRALSPREHWEDALIMGLRLTDGVDVDGLRRNYGLDLWARYGDHLRPYLESGHLRAVNGRIRLSRQGMLLANEVLAVFIE